MLLNFFSPLFNLLIEFSCAGSPHLRLFFSKLPKTLTLFSSLPPEDRLWSRQFYLPILQLHSLPGASETSLSFLSENQNQWRSSAFCSAFSFQVPLILLFAVFRSLEDPSPFSSPPVPLTWCNRRPLSTSRLSFTSSSSPFEAVTSKVQGFVEPSWIPFPCVGSSLLRSVSWVDQLSSTTERVWLWT